LLLKASPRPASTQLSGQPPQVVETTELESRPGEVIQSLENVSNFIKAVQALDIPANSIFSLGDLNLESWEERPRVVECLLCLKRLDEAARGVNIALRTPGPAAALPLHLTAQSPPAAGSPSDRIDAIVAQHYMPATARSAPAAPGPGALAGSGGVAAAAGVTRLMQQCTAMLRERMADGGRGSPVRCHARPSRCCHGASCIAGKEGAAGVADMDAIGRQTDRQSAVR
jgi:hypothetical protein